MGQESLIKSRDRVQKFAEVFTPAHIVNDMLDMLEKENPDAFQPERTFLEPSCGEGIFILEILKRKFARCHTRADFSAALESVYGFEIQADNVEITIRNVTELCRQYFKPSKKDLDTVADHIIQCDSLKVMKLLSIYGDIPATLNVISYGNIPQINAEEIVNHFSESNSQYD